MLKHFKKNHVIQFMYLCQLLVDANGVLVLLKFLNQDFSKVTGDGELDEIIQLTICSLLRLMYKTCRNQRERIKSNLV
jgi:hypothetical protein